MAGRRTGRPRLLLREPSATAAARVFCIPYAGCGASIFRNWPRHRDGVEYLALELPGRETRMTEPPLGSYGEIAESVVADLAPYLDVPFAFFGHCWSAPAGYEVCIRLQEAGGPMPSALFVSSQVAPQDGPRGRMLGMDEGELEAELAATISSLGGTPHPDLVALYLDVLRADVEVSRHYVVPDPTRLACPITAIGWTDDDEVAATTMGGWDACGTTTSTVLPGHHRTFVDAPPDLLGVLSTALGAPYRRAS